MPRSMEHYGYAQALAEAQLALDEYRSSLKSSVHPVAGLQVDGSTLEEGHDPGLDVLQSEPPAVIPTAPPSQRQLIPYILSNLKTVRSACKNLRAVERYFHEYHHYKGFGPTLDQSRMSRIFPLSSTERHRFTLVYYRWRTLSVLLKYQRLTSKSFYSTRDMLRTAMDFFVSTEEREFCLIAVVSFGIGGVMTIQDRDLLAIGRPHDDGMDKSMPECVKPYRYCQDPLFYPWEAALWAIRQFALDVNQTKNKLISINCGCLILLDDYQYLLDS
ncbi:MAG: hypothetical protein Q9186_004977 [Xanthomendoza sp. 1 TL-2023]